MASILRRLYHFVSTFSKTPLLTHSLSLSLTHSLYPPSAMQNTLFSVAAATACHFALPTYGKNQRGAVTKSTQLQTRDEDHATLCDPLTVAGQAVCASLAFSIAVPALYIQPIPPPN